jgi:hypothetical protein
MGGIGGMGGKGGEGQKATRIRRGMEGKGQKGEKPSTGHMIQEAFMGFEWMTLEADMFFDGYDCR